ncbi:hypothetical protein [Kineosporia sp. R_H_3]|uniref:hypothetical protein n=1 Tax=Kineosporia sp. R_H_3 TaxID=1961848 RepID=UPI000B4A75FC|nr:hypothetical protein [Kineosporia sp. R_H_3]
MAASRDPQPLYVAPAWVEAHCVVPDGFRRGAPFRLYDFQLTYLLNFYLVRGDARWIPDSPLLGPAFVHRRGLLVGPQKIGKGPKSAAHVCLEGVGPALFAGWAGPDDGYACRDYGCGCGWEYVYEPGEPMGMPWPTPLIQITALSQEQVDNVYGALRPMIELGPLDDVVPRTGEEFIRLPGGGRIDAVTSSAQSRLGQRVTFVPQDEVGLWTKTNKMQGVADTQYRGLAGMGGRASLTTNAWDPSQHSVAQQQFESSAKDVYRQFAQAPRTLSYKNKRDRRKIHQAVYGETLRSAGGHVDDDSIEAEAADLLERDPAQAERFFGNRIVSGAGTWCPPELWTNGGAKARTVPDGLLVCAGFDGSDVDDWTALRLETADGHRFTPTYGPDARPTIWDPAEWDGQIPRAEVHAAVAEVFRRYVVLRMYCDPRDWRSEIADWANEHGEKVVIEWATNRIVQMHSALERTLTDLKTGRSTHDECPITTRHVGNARKAARSGDRYILAKPSPQQKIDAAMADVLAHEAAQDAHAAGDFDRMAKARSRSKKMVVL